MRLALILGGPPAGFDAVAEWIAATLASPVRGSALMGVRDRAASTHASVDAIHLAPFATRG